MAKPAELAPGIYWVGAVDWNIRYFHGPAYTTHRGTTYNAYLIVDDKIALVDTVYAPFAGDMLEKIRTIIDPSQIDYMIANHAEVDHSGSIPEVIRLAPKAKVICSQRGMESLKAYYGGDWDFSPVKTGDTLTLGRRTLSFIEAPMLHWPDSMFTYVQGDAILLPNDAFGQHYASTGRFDDQVDLAEVMEEAAKYYANILMPFNALIAKKLEELQNMKLPIKVIGPSHGIIWRQDPGRIVEAYRRWAAGEAEARAIVAYDTMWQSTEKMALALVDGLESAGVETRVYKLSVSDRNDIIREILDARALLVGSPTINNGILPVVAPLLDDLVGLRPKNKLGLAFGSYGWSGGAVKAIEERLQAAKIELAEPGLAVKWVPRGGELENCFAAGQRLGRRIKGET